MCGICGKFSFQSQEKVSEDLLDRMCWQIRHCGPDNQGMYVKGRIGLGMRRLSINDVAAAASLSTTRTRPPGLCAMARSISFRISGTILSGAAISS